jgi:hypothetical protein
LIMWYLNTYWWNYSRARIWVLSYNNHTSMIQLCVYTV